MSRNSFLFIPFCLVLFLLSGLVSSRNAEAGPTDLIKNLFPKSVEADPEKEYRLEETNGPWLILVTSFSGPNGKENANALVHELRKKYKYKAYLYDKTFVHDINAEQNQTRNPYAPKRNYKRKGAFQEYAVLIGDFQSVEDIDFQNTLKGIKECHPDCIYRFHGKIPPASIPKGTLGPFRMSFAVTNPILPTEFFAKPGTVDKFIEMINAQRPYSLLNCPRRYTVQVATFTGKVEIKPGKVQRILDGKESFTNGKVSELELGEKAAAKLCRILREQGFEAYEFHDRYASIVTVGSFDSYGQKLPNGLIETHPDILGIMNQFQGKPAQQGVTRGTISHEPRRFEGIECDVQPRIIEVPRARR